MTELRVDENEDIKSGYTINLLFEGNPYFHNKCLSKAFHFNDEGIAFITRNHSISQYSPLGEMAIVPSPIQWKDSDLVSQNSDSFFATWFQSNPNGEEDTIADVIHDSLWPNPLQSYMAIPTD
jgi:template-activating factor I